MMRGIESVNALALLSINDTMKAFLDNDVAKGLIVEATLNNPRRLKRYLNTLLVLEALAGPLDAQQRLVLSKVLLIQMRFPALYYELLRDEDIAQSLSDILALKKLEQEAEVERRSDVVKSLYADQSLRQFLDRTRNIPCSAAVIKPWIQLTHGNPLAYNQPGLANEVLPS